MQSTEAIIQSAGRCIATVLPLETHLSYPIPLRGGMESFAAFLYCKANVVYDQGIYLLPPSHLGLVNCNDGSLKIRLTRPTEFGQIDPQEEVLGVYKTPEGVSDEEFLASKALLYRSYDVLLPAFFANQTNLSPEVRQSVRDFRLSFKQVSEEALLRYYHAAGRDFFAWLDQVA